MRIFKRQDLRIIFEIIFGMLFSSLISSILIWIGYYIVNLNNLMNYNVNVLGLEIFKIKNAGESGTPLKNNMMYLGVICSILFVIFGEIFAGFRKKK
ncbi:hypothetical protein FC40_GL001323 [Ligilactobacillus hayakitensis DSM 18933 = JCM 14209]|uniref:Uncharacterized protein n=1 Tax=Ligilactobacillus hayakitensis DSM 18933 = JCM 14209 TaxID=1423755 RepID=A0A0R1X044_9LACO|nr:DUF5963 family protein [Ligilactobacillus hayakitensis]KRM19804.1 hypothetical protein FC40_GL001323 [Ligilactobacillus hayakitensis DSM 18933 = JCM 14209]